MRSRVNLILAWLAVMLSMSGCRSTLLESEQVYHEIPEAMIPALSIKGPHQVGVRTLEFVNPQQLNIMTQELVDRALVVEVWYPAQPTDSMPLTHYSNETLNKQRFSIQANAYRDVQIARGDNPLPLVVISHGHPGYRTMMFYLGEHLASHGYIVAAIDHTDSTNTDIGVPKDSLENAASALYNRSRDQQFLLQYLTSKNSFVRQHIDTERAGLVGYSMGGYGAINTVGGCYSYTDAVIREMAGLSDPKQITIIKNLLNSCAGGQYKDIQVDKKWRAAMLLAPWGNQYGLFDNAALANIKIPMLYVAGELDDVAPYASIKLLFENTGARNTYLLTYHNARHNIAPHPPPTIARSSPMEISHYYNSSWDNQTLNQNNNHFALALMNCHVKQLTEDCAYLQLHGDSDQNPIAGVKPKPWLGFPDRYSAGMSWRHK
jgi:predicted dienelactone hydrolase